MAQQLTQVDAFTERPFRGNPAAVCVLDAPRDDDWMQSVAAELALSETAFLTREKSRWRLRWFTPTTEVRLCGHATLASAHHLWEAGLVEADEIEFETLSGRLTARRTAGGIELDFPVRPVAAAEAPPGLLSSLGLKPEQALTVAAGEEDWLVEVADDALLRSLSPDFARLARVDARGVIVTARGDGAPFDFLSRFFGPAVGVPEDPVTGSAHCTLAPFWAARLGKTEMRASQLSARGGELEVETRGDRVGLRGRAVSVMRIELLGS
ncbi:MAG: PhzF family phenazine biosynthesis protein [Planctomycetota bacterium]